ncbi:MAG: ATP-binding protein [Marmoricola sp.]
MLDAAELWRLALEHSPVGMALVDLDGRLLTLNHALAEMLGRNVEELLGCGFQALTHPEDLDTDLALFHRALAGEIDTYRVRKRYLHASGATVWGDLSVAVARDADDRPLHFIAQIVDITRQQEHEERLRIATAEAEKDHQTLEAIFEAVSVGLLLIDRDGRYLRMNQRHVDNLKVPYPDGHAGVAGQLGYVYGVDGRTPMRREEMPSYRATQGEEFDDVRFWVGHDPATRTALSVSARQVRSPSGERIGAALAYQDVTDLLRAIQVKDDFVASVSHELRTPLTPILGHLELLCDHPALPAEVQLQLGVVERNARRLQALVSDLLDVARHRDGAVRLRWATADLGTLVRDAVEAMRPHAEGSAISVAVDAPESLLALVDERRLRQVLDNLLSNAVKYSAPGGSATVSLRSVDDTVEIVVRDTGMGISEADVEQVFSRFFRGDAAVQRHIPGTGLGLTIVASIVAAHDGTVEVASERGVGSTFRVVLPHRVDLRPGPPRSGVPRRASAG